MSGDWIDVKEKLPESFVGVQVFIPTQYPFPTVREGYVVDADDGKHLFWYVPGTREKYPVYDFIVAWKPFSDPPEWKL